METINIVIAGVVLLVVLFFIGQIMVKPIKLLWKVLLNSLIGLILLMAVNYLGAYYDFSLPINIITILIAGFLGIPGVFLLICFQLLL
ncbi:MAG: pro-sigmaK processing inhibitor BofA family protein [Deltaproteobacteria bacterium]